LRLRRAIIFARDMGRMTGFYREGVGLGHQAGEVADGWVELGSGEATLALHAIPEAIAREIRIDDPPRARQHTPIKLVFEVDELEAAGAQLTAHGATLSERWGWGAYDVTDPEGNVFQIVGPSGEPTEP